MSSLALRTLALAALAVALSGCASGGSNSSRLSCPTAFIAPNLDAYTVFRPGAGTGPEDIQFGVRLVGVDSPSCHAEKTGVRVDTLITFQTARNDPRPAG